LTPKPVWTLWIRETSLVPDGNQTTIPPVYSILAETTYSLVFRRGDRQLEQLPLSRPQEQITFHNLQQNISVPQT
jgi:hypothetical protein